MTDNKLTNIEFLCLKMQQHPGKSGRFYRGELCRYAKPGIWRRCTANMKDKTRKTRKARRDRPSDWYSQYFRSSSYTVGRYWKDKASRTIHDPMPWLNKYKKGQPGEKKKPRKSKWVLTQEGWDIANRARRKLGLEEIPYGVPNVVVKNMLVGLGCNIH